MTPHYSESGVTLYAGDAREVLAGLPDESVNCCVTSPPYWGLRDYGTAKWEGGDPTCDHRRDNNWPDAKNPGAASANGHGSASQRLGADCGKCGARRIDDQIGLEETPAEYVEKLVQVFRSVRRVLRDDGTLWLNLGDSYAGGGSIGRNDTTAEALARRAEKYGTGTGTGSLVGRQGSRPQVADLKPKDLVGIPWRVAFALQADGWYLRSDIIWSKRNCMPESVADRPTKSHEYIFLLSKSERYFYDSAAISEPAGLDTSSGLDSTTGRRYAGVKPDTGFQVGRHFERRNKRSVWSVSTEPFEEAHFAVFPTRLIEPCILAGCPAGGMVIDPFTGAGTTALVAKENGRRFVGSELNPEYCAMAARRVAQEVLQFTA